MTSVPHPQTEQSGPYATAALRYQGAGWAPLPLPAGKKGPVPTGWTGRDGAWPSGADVYAWTEDRPDGNLALRLPPNVIGIDVDAYGDKPGGLVLAQHEQTLGQLPATWRSTSRDDGTSGIRLYRIPEGHRWPGELGPGIEIIRHAHRYTVAWPSTHPDTGSTYRWITPDGATALEQIPTPDDLPDLPEVWIDHFTKGEESDQPAAGLDSAASSAWLTDRGAGYPCQRIQNALDRATGDLTSGSRHEAALAATNRLVWLAGEGHPGASVALRQLGAAFVKATTGDRGAGEAEAEWDRMVLGAVDLAAAAWPEKNTIDPCTDPFAGLGIKEKPWNKKTCTTSATSTASDANGSTSTPSTFPSPSSKGQASTSADEDTCGPADGGAPASTPSTSTTQAGPSSPELDRDKLHLFYLEELARITGRQAAQKHYEETNRDSVVADRVRRRLLDDEAKALHREATEPPAPPFDAGTLADILARPDDPPMRAAGLIPWESSTLIVAARKAGKTTAMLNYIRCLLTGEPFLGEFPVIPLDSHQRIAFLNYEVTGKMLARWAEDIGIDRDRLYLVNLRGRRNPLGHAGDRAELSGTLRGLDVGAILVDPFGRAYYGESQNDNAEVQRFLIDLDMFTRQDVGATDLVLAAHAGWEGSRTRGASALEDWPDTIINLLTEEKKNGDDISRKRFMKALGRDVEVSEDELFMDPLTRILSRSGTGASSNGDAGVWRRDERLNRLARLVTQAVNEGGEAMSKTGVGNAVKDMPEALKHDLTSFGEQLLKDAISVAAEGEFIVSHAALRAGDKHVIHRRDMTCEACGKPADTPTAPKKGTARSGLGAVPTDHRSPTPEGGSGGSGPGVVKKNEDRERSSGRWVSFAGGTQERHTETGEVRTAR